MKSLKKPTWENKDLKIIFLPQLGHGIGHITRSETLAQQFEKENIVKVIPLKDWSGLENLTANDSPDIVVFDLLSPPPFLDKFKALGIFTVAVYDFSNELLIGTDLAFNSNPAMTKFAKDTSKKYYGAEYAIVNSFFAQNRSNYKINKDCRSILVTFGGSDPKRQTVSAYEALKDFPDCKKTFVLGPEVNYDLKASEINDNNIEILKAVSNTKLASLMLSSDIALSAAGNTMYELACLGVPSIICCNHQRHLDVAAEFEKRGAAVNLGITPDTHIITKAVRELIYDLDKRKSMHEAARKLVDGKGSARVAKIILQEYFHFRGISKSA